MELHLCSLQMCIRDRFNAELASLDFNAEEYTELANEWREKLIEAIADFDEDIMEKYFAGEEIPEAELKAAIRKATINVDFYPMLAGSAFKNKGCLLYTSRCV